MTHFGRTSDMTNTSRICAAFVMAIFVLTMLASDADARGRTGSHWVGGYTSHGKGGHYVGGH